MAQRIRQMLITNNSEHKINWSVKLDTGLHVRGGHGGQKLLKSIGNIVFLRGDSIYDQGNLAERVFSHEGLYTKESSLCESSGLRTLLDS